ncbi:MAG: cyclopropane fatty acyl phospholipid synthase, partial [Desulfocapsaceae bacterium]|nr:cyclopropane fatty acyl phospholipid synthase [Desulfocapsaceae bacterium]
YWKEADTLEKAQQDKLDIICRKLKLSKRMRLLDIGCGWGSLIHHAARHYGVEAVGITVSTEQADYAEQRCRGLPVTIILQDYRNLTGQFDAIASVGMFEHVGYKNYPTFMQVVRRCLKKNGLFLLHTIGSNRTQIRCDQWFDKYIFPNGMLPAIVQIGDALEGNFVMEDWHNLGVDYDRTLMAWYQNFEKNWNKIKSGYSESFFRMWRYYLLSLAGGFRARHMQVWQIVASPKGNVKGYTSVRCPECVAVR